jgi:GT2 family glycosyltransferase
MIIAAIPYCPANEGKPKPEPGKDLGYAINQFFDRLRPGDWGLILDHDLMLTTRDWYRRMERAVLTHPDAGFFTTMRYPAVNLWSVPAGIDKKKIYDIRYHRQLGKHIAEIHEGKIVDVTDWKKLKPAAPTSGIFLVARNVWKKIGGFKNGFKHIDHDFHKRVMDSGLRCYLMRDVYMYHAKGL